MKHVRLITLTLMCACISSVMRGQDDEQPLSPQLDQVTVDPLTGFAVLRWLLSASPDVGSYVIYTYSGGTANAVDTIRSPYITEYTHTASAARYTSVTYVVAAMDSSQNISPLSNSLSTVFLSAVSDTCHGTIELSWSPYQNPLHPADSYVLWLGTGTGSMAPDSIMPLNTTSLSVSDLEPSTIYCFYVSASHEEVALSSSNRSCVRTGSEILPAWVSIDALSVTANGLSITGTYDSEGSTDSFIIQKFEPSSSEWVSVESGSGSDGNITIEIAGADTGSVHLYRTAILNSCGVAAVISSPARNILLQLSVTGTMIDLRWNDPFPSDGAVYSLWRETGSGWGEIGSEITDTVWSEDYSSFAHNVSSASISYQITAIRTDSPAGAPVSRSNIALAGLTENIYMPNAFTPDDDGLNDIFMPVLSFLPISYEMRIYSRNGVLLFSTADHATGWDGRHNGSPMASGVYLWIIRIKTPSGRIEIRRGTVTIMP
jgi:gliding motility-associated-like protein